MKNPSLVAHLPLILGIVLPLAFIILVFCLTYFPALGIKPAHDFIYTQQDNTYYTTYKNEYRTENGRIVIVPTSYTEPEYVGQVVENAPRLYRYDSETGAVTEVSFAEVRDIPVTPGPTSPDGYNVEFRYGSSGFLFGGSDQAQGYYITKGGVGKKLSGISGEAGWYNADLQVVGWVE